MKQSNPKETSVLGRIQSGDREVLIELYKAHEKMTIRHVINNSGKIEDAQDLLQEALVVLWQNARKPGFDLTVKPATYLNAVIKNLWLKQLSKRKYLKDESYISGREVALNADPVSTMDYSLVHKALDALGDTC
ncbi:MAG: RNA polymerase sigma factor, partial [Bacteroidota bacterium]